MWFKHVYDLRIYVYWVNMCCKKKFGLSLVLHFMWFEKKTTHIRHVKIKPHTNVCLALKSHDWNHFDHVNVDLCFSDECTPHPPQQMQTLPRMYVYATVQQSRCHGNYCKLSWDLCQHRAGYCLLHAHLLSRRSVAWWLPALENNPNHR